jgi:small-conductance mechanosensitive channel
MEMVEKYLSQSFWEKLYSHFTSWVIETVPAIILIVFLFITGLTLYNLLINKVKYFLLKKSGVDPKAQSSTLSSREKRVNTLISILKQTGAIVLWSVFFMIFLREIGINIAPVLASAGIAGLAIGFGAQELVRDYFSGFFILLENRVATGDVAIINGTGGLVEALELRTITLRDFSGVVHVFQNGKIDTLANMTKEWSAMVFDIGVAYKEDIDRVMSVMRRVASELEEDPAFAYRILEPLEIFGVEEFADSAVVVRARYKTMPIEQWNVGREYRKRLKAAFDLANIEIPFPHQTIYWGENIEPLSLKLHKKAIAE